MTSDDATSRSEVATRWVSFSDDTDTTWLFDLTFLTSGWSCTFGTTCPGTEPGDNGARGCCAHGAYLLDDDEREAVAGAAARLTAAQWQNRQLVSTDQDLFDVVDDEPMTRQVDQACIFLNDPDFAGGHGCALHIGAVAANERPLDWKPAVCWQVPFRLEEFEDAVGTRTVVVRAWRRTDWGDGGADFGWWCTDDLPAGDATNATWIHHQDELKELVGEWPVGVLNDYLAEIAPGTETAVELTRKE